MVIAERHFKGTINVIAQLKRAPKASAGLGGIVGGIQMEELL
jgi:hypothetical protein